MRSLSGEAFNLSSLKRCIKILLVALLGGWAFFLSEKWDRGSSFSIVESRQQRFFQNFEMVRGLRRLPHVSLNSAVLPARYTGRLSPPLRSRHPLRAPEQFLISPCRGAGAVLAVLPLMVGLASRRRARVTGVSMKITHKGQDGSSSKGKTILVCDGVPSDCRIPKKDFLDRYEGVYTTARTVKVRTKIFQLGMHVARLQAAAESPDIAPSVRQLIAETDWKSRVLADVRAGLKLLDASCEAEICVGIVFWSITQND